MGSSRMRWWSLLLLSMILSLLGFAASPSTPLQAQAPVASGAVSFDKEEVYHLFNGGSTANPSACIYSNENPPYVATSALSWVTFNTPHPRLDLAIYTGVATEGTPEYTHAFNWDASGFNAAYKVLASCEHPVRTYVMRLYAASELNSTYGTGIPLAQAALIVRGTNRGQTENLPDVQYIGAYSKEASQPGVLWCDDAEWFSTEPGSVGKVFATSWFTAIRDGLVPVPNRDNRSRFKRQAVTVGINAFDYRKPGVDHNGKLDDLDYECISKKIERAMALAEELDVPIDLHITFSTHTANRPDLWNHWVPTGAVPSPWIQQQATKYTSWLRGAYNNTNYYDYVGANYNPNNVRNVEWTDKGILSEAVSKAMKTNFLGWAAGGTYTTPQLNLASPDVRAAIQQILTQQVIPPIQAKVVAWHNQPVNDASNAKGLYQKDYLLAGLTIGLEDSFMAHLCRPGLQDTSDPHDEVSDYCFGNTDDAVPSTYGYMAWMTKGCTTAPCANPTGDRIATLNTVLKEYEELQHQVVYRLMPQYVREKIYSHVYYHNLDDKVLCNGAFNGYAHFGASFYANASALANCGSNDSLTYRFSLNNYDSWSIAEAGVGVADLNDVPYVLGILEPSATDINRKPNVKLAAFNTWNDMPSATTTSLQNYLTRNPTIGAQQNRVYSGALSTPSEVLNVGTGWNGTIGLTWGVNGPPQWQQAGTQLKLRWFIDNYSDGTFDEYYPDALFIGPNPFPNNQALLTAFPVGIGGYPTRTYVYELVAGTNQSHVIAREKVKLVRQP